MIEIKRPLAKEIITTLRVGAEVLAAATAPVIGVKAVSEFLSPQTVEAATPCTIQVAFHSFNYIDMYPINGLGRPNKIDNTEDPKLGAGVNMIAETVLNGEVVLSNGTVHSAQIQRRTLPDAVKAKLPNVFDRTNPNLTEEGYGITKPITAECGVDRQVKVLVRTSQNPSDAEPRIVKDKEILNELVGRVVVDPDAIKKASKFLPEKDPRRQTIEGSLNDPKIVESIKDQFAEAKRVREGKSTANEAPKVASVKEDLSTIQTQLEKTKQANEEKDKEITGLKNRLEEQAKGANPFSGFKVEGKDIPVIGILEALAVGVVGLALLTDRPTTRLQKVKLNRLRTRLANTVAWPVRYPLYRRALARYNAQVAAGVVPVGGAPTAPVRPWGI